MTTPPHSPLDAVPARPAPTGAHRCPSPALRSRVPRQSPPPRCAEEPPAWDAPVAVHLDDPGALLAAIPALVGFPPERSLVVAVLRARPGPPGERPGTTALVDAVLRFDLHNENGAPLPPATVADCVASIDGPGPIEDVLAVVVDDRLAPGGRPGIRPLITALAGHLGLAGIGLGAAYALPGFAPGARWQDLLDPAGAGPLPDPATSAVTFGHVLAGQPVRGSRAELTALLAPDPALTAAVARELPAVATDTRVRYADAVRRGVPDHYSRRSAEFVLWQIAATESGAEPEARELARLAVALRDRPVRDIMFALAAGEHAPAAERLWQRLTRAVTGSDRAEAATLAGYSAYLRGDGPLAGIAFDVALDAQPGHPMAVLLETSLRAGMRPSRLRRLVRCGHESAADIGLDLGTQP